MFKKISNEEYEELFGNVPIKDYEKICKYIQENFVEKDKIKEKIEFYKEKCVSDSYNKGFHNTRVDVLEELLEEV